jgi:hypothetical protein
MSNASCIEKSTFLYTTQTKLKIKTINNKEILEMLRNKLSQDTAVAVKDLDKLIKDLKKEEDGR